ncbi:hypothetical protein HS088_TW16G00464 [Tripterygium wilfordii]|uniref:SPARK domain-containing protein n=1 Tax=Tripterygium wilfordii TaxID=458696 RepID=A0A7J7CIX3_TRIWF|nr:uncharacterized GPI-anchored protein At4g28100-like [Tripterygium wilfordii]KAF5734023.1 hypothetical protein HS088_TW16G00464 [Tripterygium wilfordii]
MSPNRPFLVFLSLSYIFSPVFSSLPDPHPVPATIQPFLPNSSPSATIPAFPEQSNIAGCPLDLSDELFHSIKGACGTNGGKTHLKHNRCCPVLAAWLYSAYSATALGGAARVGPAISGQTQSYDMPLLPDDSETCVDNLGKALMDKGIDLVRPNETCDLVSCYCGIRLHPLSCPEAFSVNQRGKIVGDKSVMRLERDCLSSSSNVDELPGLGGCSRCLNSLYKLNSNNTSNSSKLEDRTTKIQNKDCQLMGLTWLLSENRTAYINTVSTVLRAIMMSTDGSNPQSCTLDSDGLPLAVDSSEFSGRSSSTKTIRRSSVLLSIVSLYLSYMCSIVSSPSCFVSLFH